MITIAVDGVDEILRELRKAETSAREDVIEILRDEGKKLRDKAKADAPVYAGLLRAGIRSSLSKKKLQATVSAGGRVRGQSTFYAKFVEFGTKKKPARPYLYNNARAAEPGVENRLRQALERAARKSTGE